MRGGGVLAIAFVAASVEPACGSSSGSPPHDASPGGTDASGSGGALDGSTAASSSSGGASGGDSGNGSGDDSGADSSAGKGDSGSGAIQKPGPSVQLFDNPYYQCLRNFYVATGGKDSNDGTTPATAWATIA